MGSCSSSRRHGSSLVIKATQEEFDAAVSEVMDSELMTREQAMKTVQKNFLKKKIDMSNVIVGFRPMDSQLLQSPSRSHACTESDMSESGRDEHKQVKEEAQNRPNVSTQMVAAPANSSYAFGVNVEAPTLDLSSHETLMF